MSSTICGMSLESPDPILQACAAHEAVVGLYCNGSLLLGAFAGACPNRGRKEKTRTRKNKGRGRKFAEAAREATNGCVCRRAATERIGKRKISD